MMNSTASQRTVRLLMALWDGALSQGTLFKKVKKSGKSIEDYQSIVEQLIQNGEVKRSGEKLCELKILQVSKDLFNAVIYNLLDNATMQCNPIF
jgi:K+-sensing histidine kinase KdpD